MSQASRSFHFALRYRYIAERQYDKGTPSLEALLESKEAQ
jgi:hypothetical protein